MRITSLTVSDVSILRGIARDTFIETFSEANKAEDIDRYLAKNFSEDQLARELSNPNSFFYVAEVNGNVVGYLKLNTAHAQTEPQAADALEIERIYVLGSYHGGGVGQALYHHAMSVAEDRKASYVWLGVWEHNHRALRFYEKNGFIAFGTHIFQLGNDQQTDILMKKSVAA
ncbi:GNAT family N-acetyltransferase [Rothia dentocariosa]|uniref:GNAT family N-acetyltransferase n=1 Tax=Rothia dentocariosa TaxID=2047 RepID=A0A2A8D6I0_9MICC|nr:GNAT family N-acetyltransferase [Rothia dentocariosa]PEN16592.1 GNAT family N-acetyltransferase [Rothia dentocariosa]